MSSACFPSPARRLRRLRELKLQNSARSDYVFPQPSGFPGPYEYFDAHWRAALEAAGISGFRFHDLRHTCASMLAAQGASLLEIADVLGHRTLNMVKRYSHLVVDHKAKVIEEMVAAIQGKKLNGTKRTRSDHGVWDRQWSRFWSRRRGEDRVASALRDRRICRGIQRRWERALRHGCRFAE